MDQNNKVISHFEQLKEKWQDRHKKIQADLWTKHKDSLNWFTNNVKQLAVGSSAALMLLNSPTLPMLPAPETQIAAKSAKKEFDKSVFFLSDLHNILPKEIRPLTPEEENKIGDLLTRNFGFKASATLNDVRLNRSYGLIGAEQHLARFPGDEMKTHFDTWEEARRFTSSGMAPGLGGWGYFSPSITQFTEKDKQREKYYIAVQTFLAPRFKENPRKIIDFFKFRKMLLVNPNNGKAIVAVVGDAGPSEWTGKHLGGSPEVMDYLEREDGGKKGPVLYFFIDDPEDKVPLGPINV